MMMMMIRAQMRSLMYRNKSFHFQMITDRATDILLLCFELIAHNFNDQFWSTFSMHTTFPPLDRFTCSKYSSVFQLDAAPPLYSYDITEIFEPNWARVIWRTTAHTIDNKREGRVGKKIKNSIIIWDFPKKEFLYEFSEFFTS